MYPQTRLHVQSIWIRLLSLLVLTWLLAACGQGAPARVEPTESDVADTNGDTGPTEAPTQQPEEAATPTEAPVASPETEEAVSSKSEAPPVAAGILMEEQRALGDPDAPITMVVYSDFQ